MDYPKLRYGLEALPVHHQGQQLFLLRDRMGYGTEPLVINPVLVRLLMQMNGENSLRDLQTYYMRMTGERLFLEKLQEILAKLDEHLFLENDRFIEHVANEVSRFRRDPVRRMQFAGKSYPEDGEALRRQLRSFFVPENGGPGIPKPGSDHRQVVGLVAPHIDIQAGGRCFAHAYKAAHEAVSPQTWVVIGTGHEPLDNYFTLTRKDFETPFGQVRCDRAFCEALSQRAPKDLLAGEYSHHREHTIEFQAVFLAHMHPDAQIVPLLCSFSLEDWESDRVYIDEVAQSLRELAQTGSRSVGFIASVDLAHIGPRYGDSFQPNEDMVSRHLRNDEELLKCLETCDAESFIRILHRDGNCRRICGMAPLYVLAKVMKGWACGEILHHAHAVVDHQNSFVTFASMVFYLDA